MVKIKTVETRRAELLSTARVLGENLSRRSFDCLAMISPPGIDDSKIGQTLSDPSVRLLGSTAAFSKLQIPQLVDEDAVEHALESKS